MQEKGIIMINDIPVICAECMCCQTVASGKFLFCGANKKTVYNAKPDWCPIRSCHYSESGNISLIGEEKESVVLSPKELMELLRKAPQDDILMVEINDGKDESGVIEDVMVGGGTNRGFTFIKVSTDI